LQNYPAKLLAKNCRQVHVLINSNVFWQDDKFVHSRCFTRDISELVKLEAEKVNQINELQQQNSALRAEIVALKNKDKPSEK
jgi:hypothetical protein